jgi:biotin carboxylase
MPYFNRFPGLEILARKKTFCAIVNRMRKTFPKTIKFCPISFQLPEEGEELEAYMKEHPKFTFISKAVRGRGGEGIMLVQRFQDLP